MIAISGKKLEAWQTVEGFAPDALQHDMIDAMLGSGETYAYDSMGQLVFELKTRGAIASSARELSHSGMRFSLFLDSTANPDYWTRTAEGGFQLNPGAKPSDAVRDIYQRGYKYGTECSTAMLVVYYGAMLRVFPEELYNRIYAGIYLFNWESPDRDLALREYAAVADELPGDARYFINPDVDPLHPEWQGENAFYLGGGRYYGHGIGITSAENIIRALNGSRRPGATREAYLLPGAKRQDYKYLNGVLNKYLQGSG